MLCYANRYDSASLAVNTSFNKRSEFTALINETNPDVMALTEIMAKNKIKLSTRQNMKYKDMNCLFTQILT